MARSALEQLKLDAAKKLEADINKSIVALLKVENVGLYERLESEAIKEMQTPKKRTKKVTSTPPPSSDFAGA